MDAPLPSNVVAYLGKPITMSRDDSHSLLARLRSPQRPILFDGQLEYRIVALRAVWILADVGAWRGMFCYVEVDRRHCELFESRSQGH